MKKLLYTTTAFVLCGYMAQANAACIATPTCSSLGYTSSSSCDGGLKCPFGEAWNCEAVQKITELTNQITELENKINQQSNPLKDCTLGNIFFSDRSCSTTLVDGKIPIGVVVYDNGQGHGQVMSLEILSKKWGTTTVKELLFHDTIEEASSDMNSCSNTAKIIAAGDKNTYPAAWAAHEYSTQGTKAGDWCLPAAGVYAYIIKNENLISKSLESAGGEQLITYNTSSTIKNDTLVWAVYFSDYKAAQLEVAGREVSFNFRPVFEF